ncbi:MAG: flavin reductase [Flavobacteriaceae bacterium]|nr:flavin reductase [Flavobacteriaceae bacterium]
MKKNGFDKFISLNVKDTIWDHFYTVAPLVVIGSKEKDVYDLSPKHMVTPIGFSNYLGFVCTPRHVTYHNIKKEKKFTVSFVRPSQILLTSLSAIPRCENNHYSKEIVNKIPTIPTAKNDNIFIADSYVLLECTLYKIIDGFDDYSIITGQIEAAFVHKDYKIFSEVDQQKHIYDNPLLAYIAQGRFASIKETFSFPYPKDFQR